jgi:hypothetical protein
MTGRGRPQSIVLGEIGAHFGKDWGGRPGFITWALIWLKQVPALGALF